MVRTQIQLTDRQASHLKEISRNSSESVASIIRQAIDQVLMKRKPDRKALYRKAVMVIGKYETDAPDVSIKHDDYLKEVFSG